VVRAAPDMAHRTVMVQPPAAVLRGIRVRGPNGKPPLTRLGAWASVATLAGIIR